MNIFLFLALGFAFTFLVGKLLEKFHIPWIFGALLFGSLLSILKYDYFSQTNTFIFLAKLGMYFLLFVVGLELDLKELLKESSFIFRSVLFIVLFETLFGMLFVHYIFNVSWLISFIVALSFATVGEAILLPILDEFNMLNTKLGKLIVGIGTLDDIFEILALFLVIMLLGTLSNAISNVLFVLTVIIILFLLTFLLGKLKRENQMFMYLDINVLFFFVLIVFFLFLGIGNLVDVGPLAALLAGIGLKTFIPDVRFGFIEKEVKALSYGFFAPIFFIKVGWDINFNYLFYNFVLVLAVFFISSFAKIIASIIATYKRMPLKDAITLGVGLSVKFSTSIVIISLLFNNHVIGNDIFSVIVASSILFELIIPLLFVYLLHRRYDK